MAPSTISTTFLILSDTHGFSFDGPATTAEGVTRAPSQTPLRLPMPKVDVLIHSGDLTQVGGVSEFRKALHMLSKIDAELKLVIAGNHDLELDPNFDPDEPEDHAEALALWTGAEARAAGVTYLSEGTHAFTLGSGAKLTVYASPYQPAFGDWAFGYKHDEDRFNPSHLVTKGSTSVAENPVPTHVDIMMTHGPPKGILDLDSCVADGQDQNLGCKNLLHAVNRARPLMHCFGHIHEGYGHELVTWPADDNALRIAADTPREGTKASVTTVNDSEPSREYELSRGHSTLMVNAALQTGPSEWRNAPFLVDLPLSS